MTIISHDISHDRRRILHFNVTRHPTSTWIVQQVREAFPYEVDAQILIFNYDAKYEAHANPGHGGWL